MRLGILGGSFDPIHYGHLLLAECAREQQRLDRVWFTPAAVAPHKRERETTPNRERVEMLHLALAGHESFAICEIELERGGVSYTIDTLASISEQEPEAELFFLMGADSLNDLANWREPAKICELAIPIVVRRGGTPEPDFEALRGLVDEARLDIIRQSQVEMPAMELSSTDIRQRAAEGRSIRYRTPRAVEKYIETHGLYA